MVLKVIFMMLTYLVKTRSDDTETSSSMPTTKISVGGGDNLSLTPLAWSYINGTENWCDVSEECCDESQSPINIYYHLTIRKPFPRIEFDNYDADASTFTIRNNGHSVLINLEYDGLAPSISGAGLDGTYTFASFNFHWGKDDENGTEHHFDGFGFPLEIQIVHFNTKYHSLAEATESPNGVVILGVLGEVDVNNENNTGLDDVIENLSKIKYRGQSVTLKKKEINLMLEDVIPPMTDDFYMYSGSFTIPGCQESVTWIIFRDCLQLSKEQIHEFRHLYASAEGEEPVPLTTNVRPIQELYGRTVYRVENLGSITIQHSSFFMLIAGLMILCSY